MWWLWLGLGGCLHLGVPPAAGRWTVVVEAPVAEPELDRVLLATIEEELRARHGWGGASATARVVRADWVPGRRLGEGTEPGSLVYEARLEIEVEAGGARTRLSATTSRAGLTDGASASAAREEAFSALARELGASAAGWLAARGR